ncbi:hypothetical protein, partial [Nostoc sp.]|uniref:hypothetical protein n=1 Tax=Nostoc sp. TaxID=1180 RepID=UPI003FA5368D
MQLTDSLKKLLKGTAEQLKGANKRKFIAQTVVALGHGGRSLAEQELGWNRVTITYELGVRLTKEAMLTLEKQIKRLTDSNYESFPDLGKWFIDI